MYSDGSTIFRLYFKTHLGEFRRLGSLGDDGTPSAGDAIMISDTDADTIVNTEESADEDKVRIDTGGTERVVIDSTGVDVSGIDLAVDSGQKILLEGLGSDTYFTYNSGTAYLEVYLDGTKRLEL
ncbi:hypothetical protein LCGC14_1860360, partial [marine sediment metagenome]